MQQQPPAPSLLVQRGKERLGKPVYHVEGTYRTPQGNEGRYTFNIRRSLRNRLLGGSAIELEDVRARLAALPGSPEGIPSITQGKAGPNETVTDRKEVDSPRFTQKVEHEVQQISASVDQKPAEQIARSLYADARKTEARHHELLASQDRVFHVGKGYTTAAKSFMYFLTSIPKVTAAELVSTPEKSITDALDYIGYRYLGTTAEGEKMSKGEKFLRHPIVWAGLGMIPVVGTALTFVDEFNAIRDSHKPGTKRGKAFQWTAAIGSTVLDFAAASAAVIGFVESLGLSAAFVAEVVTPAINATFNPSSIEHAKLRTDDLRYMLQVQTARSLLSPDSGVSDITRIQIARAAANKIASQTDALDAIINNKALAGDPKQYYANAIKQLYLESQSLLASQA